MYLKIGNLNESYLFTKVMTVFQIFDHEKICHIYNVPLSIAYLYPP